MEVSLGLPNAVSGTTGAQLVGGANAYLKHLFPSASDPAQVDLLADAAGL